MRNEIVCEKQTIIDAIKCSSNLDQETVRDESI